MLLWCVGGLCGGSWPGSSLCGGRTAGWQAAGALCTSQPGATGTRPNGTPQWRARSPHVARPALYYLREGDLGAGSTALLVKCEFGALRPPRLNCSPTLTVIMFKADVFLVYMFYTTEMLIIR